MAGGSYSEVTEASKDRANDLLADGWELIDVLTREFDQPQTGGRYQRCSSVVYVLGKPRPHDWKFRAI